MCSVSEKSEVSTGQQNECGGRPSVTVRWLHIAHNITVIDVLVYIADFNCTVMHVYALCVLYVRVCVCVTSVVVGHDS